MDKVNETPKEDDKFKEFADLTLEKFDVQTGDVVLLKGNWNQELLGEMAKNLDKLGINALLLVLPNDSLKLEKLPIDTFYKVMKECERRLGLAPEGDGSCTDGESGD